MSEIEKWQTEALHRSKEIASLRSLFRLTLERAKVEYWNRCYEGSGNVKAMSVAEFDAWIDGVLKVEREL